MTLDFLMQHLLPEQRQAVEEAALLKIAEFAKNPSAAGVERGPSAPAKRKKK